MSGNQFEAIVCKFISQTLPRLSHLRPGEWKIQQITGRERTVIARYEQYAHLVALDRAARRDPVLAASLGNDYTITPDIVVIRGLESDANPNSTVLIEDVMEHLAERRRQRLKADWLLGKLRTRLDHSLGG